MIDELKKLDVAMQVLTDLYIDTKSTEIADALDILSQWREDYIEANSQFGVGA